MLRKEFALCSYIDSYSRQNNIPLPSFPRYITDAGDTVPLNNPRFNHVSNSMCGSCGGHMLELSADSRLFRQDAESEKIMFYSEKFVRFTAQCS
jgi:hypothetical protein